MNLYVLFVVILYVPINNFAIMLGLIFLAETQASFSRTQCSSLLRFKPANPQSLLEHHTTEPEAPLVFFCYIAVDVLCLFYALQRSALRWSVMCECDISWLYSLSFLLRTKGLTTRFIVLLFYVCFLGDIV